MRNLVRGYIDFSNAMKSEISIVSFRKLLEKVRNRALLWDTITTTAWSTLGKAVGFLIPFFIAAWFGVSSETDAFFFAYGFVIFLSGIFAPVVESVIVPYIAEARAKNEDIGVFVGNVLSISSISLFILTGLLLLVIKPVLSVATHFDTQDLNLVYQLFIETSPLIVLLIWTSILAGTLNTYQRFTIPAVSPLFRTLVTLFLIFSLKEKWGVYSIALAYVFGELTRLIVLFVVIYRLNLFKLRLAFKFETKIREFLKTSSYQIIGMIAVSINPIVDKTMASWLGEGSVSILHYADRLYMIPVTFISTGLMVTLLSHWSSRYYELNQYRLRDDVKKITKITAIITTLMMLFLILLHQPIIKLAFGRGVFDQARLHEVGWVWICYLVGFVPYMIGLVFVRAFLVLKDTKTLLYLSIENCMLNTLLNYFLMQIFKVQGIAISTSITSLIVTYSLVSIFMKRIRDVKTI